jgi:hypothetical protein
MVLLGFPYTAVTRQMVDHFGGKGGAMRIKDILPHSPATALLGIFLEKLHPRARTNMHAVYPTAVSVLTMMHKQPTQMHANRKRTVQ